MSYGKTKKKKPSAKPSGLSWEKVREFPVGIFHTSGGPPIIAHVGKQTKASVVLWAPANLVMPPTGTTVIYLPLPFVDKYFELFTSGIRGTHPIDPRIIQGYSGYVDQFITGAYLMQPMAVGLGIDAPEGAHETKLDAKKEDKPVLEPCPACKQELSAWNAHHPVQIDDIWHCEMDMPDIRTEYPNAATERPLHN